MQKLYGLLLIIVPVFFTHTYAQTGNEQVAPADSAGPQFNFITKRAYDFGGIAVNTSASCEFQFKNTGSQPLVIKEMHCLPSDTKSLLSDILIHYPVNPVKPGKKGIITVTIRSQNNTGSFTTDVYISSNATTANYPLLVVSGSVIPEKRKTEEKLETSGYFDFLAPAIRANTK